MNELKLSKYENAVLYLCSKIKDQSIRGKKKLAKLLYYVDFDRFEFNESMETITGDSYTRLPMGPVPSSMDSVLAGMSKKGTLSVSSVNEYEGYNPTTVYQARVEPDMSLFDEQDTAILKRVERRYLNLTGKQLENLSHEEAPWLAVDHRGIIPFELAFYRDTDFSNAA
ncbi:MAG: SocA family protein [Micrococcaceae bacterium]|nr:SocA family protein [Micrococcaceae bacterium]